MKTKNEYKEALNEAKNIPTHVNGVLQEHYLIYKESNSFYISYSEDPTPASILRCIRYRRHSAQGFYLKTIPTFRADGKGLAKKSEWQEKVYFHKKWSRSDIEVKDVTFDIVGIKRATIHLPAGVLISNVNFIY